MLRIVRYAAVTWFPRAPKEKLETKFYDRSALISLKQIESKMMLAISVIH
jgi:hypothetical protein